MNWTDSQLRAISAVARYLWERAGKPTGRDDEFWYAALDVLVPVLSDVRGN